MIESIIIFCVVSASLYCALLIWAYVKFSGLKISTPIINTEVPHVSLVIACRNEAVNILPLISEINRLNYPADLLQVIFIDDNSEDDTFALLNTNASFIRFKNVKLLRIVNGKPSKKNAIDHAIQNASGEIVITTDADCKLPPALIYHHVNILNNKEVISSLGHVAIEKRSSAFLNAFQIFEMQALQIFTACFANAGKPVMCNGANFAYRKAAYESVNGFEGNLLLNTGDDVFLLHKFNAKYKNACRYELDPEAVVYTEPAGTFRAFLYQRLRWASKAAYYTDKTTKITGFIVFLGNLSMLFLYVFSFFSIILAKVLLTYFVLRVLLEAGMIKKLNFIEKRTVNMRWFLPALILYPLYSTFTAIASSYIKTEWKGSQIK